MLRIVPLVLATTIGAQDANANRIAGVAAGSPTCGAVPRETVRNRGLLLSGLKLDFQGGFYKPYEPPQELRAGDGLIIWGSVLVVLGTAGLIGGVAIRDPEATSSAGPHGSMGGGANMLSTLLISTGGTFVAAGVPVLIIGVVREYRRAHQRRFVPAPGRERERDYDEGAFPSLSMTSKSGRVSASVAAFYDPVRAGPVVAMSGRF